MKVQVHFIDVEGNVLFGRQFHLCIELLIGHRRQGNFLHNDRMAGDGDGDLLQFDILFGQQFLDGRHDTPFVHDRAVHDHFRLQFLDGKLLQRIPAPMFLDLHQFDAARTDVEPQQLPLRRKHREKFHIRQIFQ